MRPIDADVLYKKACDLEAQAFYYTDKLSHDEEKVEEWRRWSTILAERTAFKYDVNSAPTIKPELKIGRWMISYGDHEAFGTRPYFMFCSECNRITAYEYNYCPNCGAYMKGEQDGSD